MRKLLKSCLYVAVAVWFSAAHAGSYEDFFRSIKEDDDGVVVNLLKRGFDPNTPNPEGLTGLYLALREPAPKVAAVLVAWPKTNIEARTAQDESPLMMAALKGETEMVRRLIARDADVNKTGWAPLHYAATGGHLDVIQLLLDNNAFIDAESPNGTTPLMMAAMYGSPDAVKLLLDAGADVAMVNKLGLTALDFARRGGRPDAVAMMQAAMERSRMARAGTQAAPTPVGTPTPTSPPTPAPAPAPTPPWAPTPENRVPPAPAVVPTPAPSGSAAPIPEVTTAPAPPTVPAKTQRTPGQW